MTLQEIANDIQAQCRDVVYNDCEWDNDPQIITVSGCTDDCDWEVALDVTLDVERDVVPTDRGNWATKILNAADCYIDKIELSNEEGETIDISEYLPAGWEFQY